MLVIDQRIATMTLRITQWFENDFQLDGIRFREESETNAPETRSDITAIPCFCCRLYARDYRGELIAEPCASNLAAAGRIADPSRSDF
jgi:hypothetical protein